jgi:hypothetical protein
MGRTGVDTGGRAIRGKNHWLTDVLVRGTATVQIAPRTIEGWTSKERREHKTHAMLVSTHHCSRDRSSPSCAPSRPASPPSSLSPWCPISNSAAFFSCIAGSHMSKHLSCCRNCQCDYGIVGRWAKEAKGKRGSRFSCFEAAEKKA